MRRVKPSSDIETSVLVQSRRRCCLCFGLNADAGEKRGQIAHLDRDPSNSSPENLAYLCLEHHDRYDSATSQSKALTIWEVKHYRERLYRALVSLSDQGLQALSGSDRELLHTMLARAKGWYDEIVSVVARVEHINSREEFEELAFNYGHSRKYLSDLLAISRVLSKKDELTNLEESLSSFVSRLTGGWIVNGDLGYPCPMLLGFGDSPQRKHQVSADLERARTALQELTDKIFEHLAK